MLVLTRMKNEVIVIGEGDSEIRVMIVDINGPRVRVGIEAPGSVQIDRWEVRQAKLREGHNAT